MTRCVRRNYLLCLALCFSVSLSLVVVRKLLILAVLSIVQVRDAKVEVLNAIQPLSLDDMVLGQYVANEKTGEPGYLDDTSVPRGSTTETFAACTFAINNERWHGVPFIMKAGKALDERKAEVRIIFKPPARLSTRFPASAASMAPNELVVRLQPNEAIYLKTNVKEPGLGQTPKQVELDLTYKSRFGLEDSPGAYTRLILDALQGQQAAFVRGDELQAAWDIFTPMLRAKEGTGQAGEGAGKKAQPILYTFGSRGPAEADDLVRRSGYVRDRGLNYSWPVSKISKL